MNWELAESLLGEVQLHSSGHNELVTIVSYSGQLRCIGVGTDAAVFQYEPTPSLAFKVYTEQAVNKKNLEASVYERIGDSPYFARYYGKGPNFIVLSYEKGVNLYDCLLQGIPVPRQVMLDVEAARNYVRSLGFNPRDIHLKNVLLQNGRAKVLDVSEYTKEGNDNRWEHLSWAYEHLYPLIEGTKIPSWMLETVKHWYNRVDKATFAIEDFSQQVARLFFTDRK